MGERLHQQAAEMLYRLWWQEAETSTEEQRLEIHRLALWGKVEMIAVEIATTLTDGWYSRSRFLEAVEICRGTLELVENYRLLHNLAISEQELGLVDKALEHHKQVLNLCSPEDEIQKAATLHQLAILKANTGQIEEAIALFQQSLDIFERIGNAQGKAMTLWWLGHIAEQQGDSATALNYLQQSLEIFHNLQSPKAETVREVIARVQQMRDEIS